MWREVEACRDPLSDAELDVEHALSNVLSTSIVW